MCTMMLLGLIMRAPMVTAQPTYQILLTPTSLPPQAKGDTFTLTVNLTNFARLAGYQVVIKYNGTILNMTGAAFPSDYVFSNYTLVQTLLAPPTVTDLGDAKDGLNWTMIGATLISAGAYVPVSNGILCELNFTVIGIGATQVILVTAGNPVYFPEGGMFGTYYTYLLDDAYNEYNAFNSIELPIVTIGTTVGPPDPIFTVIATPPPGGNKTNYLLYAFTPPTGAVDPQICWEGEPTLFNASATIIPTGNITAYIWSFGDGNTTVVNATVPNAWLITHVYAGAGALTARLTVVCIQGGNQSNLNSAFAVKTMLVGIYLPLYDWTPFLTVVATLIVLAIVVGVVRSAVRHERRRRKMKMQARLTAKPAGQSKTAAKPT
jgi:hypothetical protein